MADITNYLNTIKTGVYGEDVRQAIHDAIEACYTDGDNARIGSVDYTARTMLNNLISRSASGNLTETQLWPRSSDADQEVFIGGSTDSTNPYLIELAEDPTTCEYILIYYKTINTATPQIKMIRGSDFAAGPTVIAEPFLIGPDGVDGKQLSIREMHIKPAYDGTDPTQYQIYFTYYWLYDDASTTGTTKHILKNDTASLDYNGRAITLMRICSFNSYIPEAVESLTENLNDLMERVDNFELNVTIEEDTLIIGGTNGDQ